MDGGSRGLVFSSPSCFNCRSNGVKRNFRNPEVKPSRFTSFTSGTLSYSSHTFERRCFSCRFTCCKTSRFKVISHLSCFHKIGPVINFYICFFLSLSLSLSLLGKYLYFIWRRWCGLNAPLRISNSPPCTRNCFLSTAKNQLPSSSSR